MKKVFEKLAIERVEEVSKSVETITKTELNTESVDKILTISPSVSLVKKENLDKKVKFTARISYFLVYSSDNEIKKMECASEFSGIIENVNDYELKDIEIVVEKSLVDTYLEEVKIISNLLVKGFFIVKEEKPLLTESQDMISKKDSLTFSKRVDKIEKFWQVEESFDLNFSVKEVLCYSVDCQIKGIKSSVGCVILDGEIFLSLSLLQKVENSDILKERRIIPFRVEIECEDTLPEMVARGKMVEKAVKIEALVDETTGKTTLNAIIDLSIFVETFEEKQVDFIVDCFSKEKEILLNREVLTLSRPLELKRECERINTKCLIENPLNGYLMSVAGEKLTITSFEEKDCLTVNGIFTCVAFFKGETVWAVELQAPFFVNFERKDCQKVAHIKGTVENLFIKPISLKEIEIDLTAGFSIFSCEEREEKVISELVITGDKSKNQKAISVYIAKKGEELFDMAKRLNSSIEDITKINSELEFPLNGDERIIIFRQERK